MTTSIPAEQTASRERSLVPLRTRVRSYFASTVGNLLEWFAWAVYAAMSPFIAAAMFDPTDQASALLATLAVFAVGFAMRPIGGIVFGIIANRRGREFVLIVTMVTMAIATLAIVFIPTYAQIGVWSSVLLVAVRLVQGFAHGGETAINYRGPTSGDARGLERDVRVGLN